MSLNDWKDSTAFPGSRITLCIVGEALKQNEPLIKAIEGFQVPVVYSLSGLEHVSQERNLSTIFILDEFEGEVFTELLRAGQIIFGPTIVLQYAKTKQMRGKPFLGCNLAFIGFQKDAEKNLIQITTKQGADITDIAHSTHVIVASGFNIDTGKLQNGAPCLRQEWCWASAQLGVKIEERIYKHQIIDEEIKQYDLNAIRCLYTTSMKNLVVTLSGLSTRKRAALSNTILYMGGNIIQGLRITETTHLVATKSTINGEKYKYASCAGIPIMTVDWVDKTWIRRREADCNATNEELMQSKMLPFVGCKLVFMGYQKEEEQHMMDIAIKNGGEISDPKKPNCTHAVVEVGATVDTSGFGCKVRVVKNEWFWECVQMEVKVRETDYVYENPCITSSSLIMPVRGNKRKRLESVAHQLAIESQDHDIFNIYSDVKRRPVEEKLSISGSFLDATFSPDRTLENSMENELDGRMKSPCIDMRSLSPRQQVCLELCQTENNYVSILHTIITVFMEPLQNDTLLALADIKIIFGNVPPIYEVHQKIRKELTEVVHSWSEDHSIGNIILNCANDLLKSYPPFVNYFENSKSVLAASDASNSRFHAFLKRCQSRPECGRQTLQELLIRPVQRLPSIILLLSDILKHTPKSNPDNQSLDQAIQALRDVMTHINEDKRKTEGQMEMFDIVNDIENCPPNLLSSHRILISKTDMEEATDLLTKKGSLTMFLFTDVLEICKKSKKNHNSLKSPGVATLTANTAKSKTYKHLDLIPLSCIKRVVDISDADDFKNGFGLVSWSKTELKELLHAFKLTESVLKSEFLSTLCRQIAHSICKADSENLLAYLDPHQLDLHATDNSGNILTKALRTTKSKLGRALSMRKTPTKRGLSRAVSTIISPLRHFGTPANSYSNIRLSSVTNLTELEPPGTHLSPSPVGGKKMRNSASLGVNSTLYL